MNSTKSLRSLERDHSLPNGCLSNYARSRGIGVKGRIESLLTSDISRPKGVDHWRSKDPEASEALALKHSKRMSENNPSHNEDSKRKITSSLAKTLLKNPTFHENLVKDVFDKLGIRYKFQEVIGGYICDFVIRDIVIEIDGRGHASRKASDRIRDKSLCSLGLKVVRVNQDSIFNKRAKEPVLQAGKLISVIKDIMPDVKVDCSNITELGKYRVLVRQGDPITEIIY